MKYFLLDTVSNSVITRIELRGIRGPAYIVIAENHFWVAFRFQKVERKWKMTVCLILGLPDEKVTKVHRNAYGTEKKKDSHLFY